MPDAIAVDLGGTNMRAVRIDATGQILSRDRTPTQAEEGFGAVVRRISELVNGLRGPETVGIGLGTPGASDPESGVMKAPAVNIPDSLGYPLGPHLSERTGLTVSLDNDANLAALGESWKGAARGEPIALTLTLGTGIGGGLVVNGELYHGVSNMTEIGHICIEVHGRPCACGCLGCFEAYASAAAVGRDACEALQSGDRTAESSKLWQRCGGDPEKVDAKMLCDAARDGDRFAGRLLDLSCEYIAAGTGSLINALNPSCVVLAGGLALAGEVLVSRVRALLSTNRAFAPVWRDCKLLTAQLGDDAGLIGAARVAFVKAGVTV